MGTIRGCVAAEIYIQKIIHTLPTLALQRQEEQASAVPLPGSDEAARAEVLVPPHERIRPRDQRERPGEERGRGLEEAAADDVGGVGFVFVVLVGWVVLVAGHGEEEGQGAGGPGEEAEDVLCGVVLCYCVIVFLGGFRVYVRMRCLTIMVGGFGRACPVFCFI